jgi:hypothetical protein
MRSLDHEAGLDELMAMSTRDEHVHHDIPAALAKLLMLTTRAARIASAADA